MTTDSHVVTICTNRGAKVNTKRSWRKKPCRELLTKNIIIVKIGVVLPTLTAAYNFAHPNYYDWYNEYYS